MSVNSLTYNHSEIMLMSYPIAHYWIVQDEAFSSLIIKVRTNIYRMLPPCQPVFKAPYVGYCSLHKKPMRKVLFARKGKSKHRDVKWC